MSMTSFSCLYCYLRAYFTTFSKVYCWLWTASCLLKLNFQCATAVKTVLSGHLRDQNKVSALEDVHFRESFVEMRLKWRKTHKRSRVWKQKHSICHYPNEPIYFKFIWESRENNFLSDVSMSAVEVIP